MLVEDIVVSNHYHHDDAPDSEETWGFVSMTGSFRIKYDSVSLKSFAVYLDEELHVYGVLYRSTPISIDEHAISDHGLSLG